MILLFGTVDILQEVNDEDISEYLVKRFEEEKCV